MGRMAMLFEDERIPFRIRIELAKLALADAMAELQYIQQTNISEARFTVQLKTLIDSLNRSNYYLNKLEVICNEPTSDEPIPSDI